MAKKKAEADAAPEEAPVRPEEPDTGPLAEEDEADEAPEKVSKMEAVRRILADDPEMKPTDGIEAIKKRFGLEMTTGNYSAYKSQIKAKDREAGPAPKAKGGRPKGSGQQKAPADTAALKPAAGRGLADTLEALRQIVREHGPEETKKLVDLFRKGE